MVSADDLGNELRTEPTGATTVFVDYLATHAKQAPPTDLPRLVRKIGVFHVKGIVEPIKAAQPQELLPVDGNRPSVPPQDRNIILLFVAGGDRIVSPVQVTAVERCPGLARFLPGLSIIR